MYGHVDSEETHKKRVLNHLGEKNSQYGKMWICNDLTRESRSILKTDPIPEGWRKGRICKKWFPEIWSELVRKRIANPSRWKSLPSSSLGISAIQRCITANNMIVSTFRAFSLVVKALAAMLETLVRIQYIALLHASWQFHPTHCKSKQLAIWVTWCRYTTEPVKTKVTAANSAAIIAD